MRLWKEESGQALVLVLLSMSMLLAFVALAVDVGSLFRARRNVQIAADAAAVAAALDYKYNGYNGSTTSSYAAARAAATANGYRDGAGGVVVTPTIPPADGPNAGSTGFAEVTVVAPNPTIFMSMFNYKTIDISARAVAGRSTTENCVFLLGTSGADFTNGGASTINLANCGLIDDSSSADAFSNGGALTMTAKSIGVVGGVLNGGALNVTPRPRTGIPPTGDPLSRPVPPTAGCGPAIVASGTYGPGCYSGITVSGAANLQFSPGGLYVFNGPIVIGGAATLTGTGVTFYFNNSITVGGTVTMRLSAPTSGTWNGILFYESPTDSQPFALAGAAGSRLQGIIYLPNSSLDIGGAANMTLDTAFVVKQLTSGGSLNLTLNDYLAINPSSPLATITLVE
jgi:hypothetical protein